MYPNHNNDIADAIKWIYDNIGKYGGDKNKIALLGHSAGAHLVSLTGINNSFLKCRGIPLSAIRGVASIDTKGYDVFEQARNSENRMMYINAFGTESSQNIAASPIYNLKETSLYPRFFIAMRGSVAFFVFDDNGNVTSSTIVSPEKGVYGLDIEKGIWHSLIVLEKNTVVYEIKQGPYAPLKPENFAPWAPNPDSSKEEIAKYNAGLMQKLF